MSNQESFLQSIARRCFLHQCVNVPLGSIALASLLESECSGNQYSPQNDTSIGLPSLPNWTPKAKNIIFLTQSGGPSQIELFDEKPNLFKLAGTEPPDSVRQGQRVTTMTSNQKQLIKPAATKFQRCGQSGATIGEWLPHLSKIADDVCFVKSMYTEEINHAPAMTKFLTGHQIPGRPSLGA